MSRSEAATCTLELSNGRFVHVACTPSEAADLIDPPSGNVRRLFVDFKTMGKNWRNVKVSRDEVIAIHDLDKQSEAGSSNELKVEIMRPGEITQKVLAQIRDRRPWQ